MDISSRINQEALRLWERTFEETADVPLPLIYAPMKQGTLLFVGLNPSFSKKGFRFLQGPYSNLDPIKYFHWSNRAGFELEIAQGVSELAKKKHPFFKKFRCVADYCSIDREPMIDWEHVDLFFYPETRAEKLKSNPLIYAKNGITAFGSEQLELSKKLILELAPKVIVVANAFASGVFVHEFNAEFDKGSVHQKPGPDGRLLLKDLGETGHHVIRINNRAVPVFLASMFTGQRAMDSYSYQRLRWQIKKALLQSA